MWRGKHWRAERSNAHPTYEMLEKFLEANPGITFARLVDIALAKFFDADPRLAALYQAEMLSIQPDMSFIGGK